MPSVPCQPVAQWKLHRGVLGKFSIKYACPGCGAKLTSPIKDAGKTDACPQCRCALLLPIEPRTQAEAIQREVEAKKAIEQAARLQAKEEENRRREQVEAIAMERAERFAEAQRLHAAKSAAVTSAAEIFGLVLGAIGFAGVIFGFTMNVNAPGSETVNFDRMQIRQNVIIFGCFAWLIGTISIATGAIIRIMSNIDRNNRGRE